MTSLFIMYFVKVRAKYVKAQGNIGCLILHSYPDFLEYVLTLLLPVKASSHNSACCMLY